MPRPPAPEHKHTKVGPTKKVSQILNNISAKTLKSMEDNPDLKPCCRNAMNHDVDVVKTHEDAKDPDMLVFTCSCGRKHYRVALAGTQLGK